MLQGLSTQPEREGEVTRSLPLQGVTVLDLGQIYNGPYASFLMAMAGARVIKIEPPDGEKMRRRGSVGGGAMLPFAMLNSNKEFVTLNLKSDRGRELFLDMARRADIVVENFAPGVMDRLGVGANVLLEANPKLVYAAGSGYGASGPYKNLLAMDLTVQAMSGVMASTGFPDRPPVKAGPALCDFFGGIHLYGAAITALLDAQRTGKGRTVEVSMMEAVYPALSSSLGLYHGLGNQNPPRTGNRHGGMAESPYNVYPAADGWVAMFCVSEAHFTALATAMDQPSLTSDPRFTSLKTRVAHMDELDALISSWTSVHPKNDLLEIMNRHRVPCAPVREIDEVVNDPHMHSRGTLRHVEHPDLGNIVLPTGPMRYGDSNTPDLIPSKDVGADNKSVYCGWLGCSEQEYDDMTSSGAI
jgi:Predicted acyl-CoA transferases/carnitine dehydratase